MSLLPPWHAKDTQCRAHDAQYFDLENHCLKSPHTCPSSTLTNVCSTHVQGANLILPGIKYLTKWFPSGGESTSFLILGFKRQIFQKEEKRKNIFQGSSPWQVPMIWCLTYSSQLYTNCYRSLFYEITQLISGYTKVPSPGSLISSL